MSKEQEELARFIKEEKDPRGIKRGLAVQMRQRQMSRKEISQVLQVGVDYVTKWSSVFKREGVAGLPVKYNGTTGYLSQTEKAAVLEWLKEQEQWDVAGLKAHLQTTYGVVYQSKQSYYDLFRAAGISWKKNPVPSA